jgi:hypothetical protein
MSSRGGDGNDTVVGGTDTTAAGTNGGADHHQLRRG